MLQELGVFEYRESQRERFHFWSMHPTSPTGSSARSKGIVTR